MPKHTIKIPCGIGDTIRVLRYKNSRKADIATVIALTTYETRDGLTIKVNAQTRDANISRYTWGISAFDMDGE